MKTAVMAWLAPLGIGALCCAAAAGAASASERNGESAGMQANLSWLFPLNPPSDIERVMHPAAAVHLPNSSREFTEAQLTDFFFAPDWHPESHAPMPDIVRIGRAPRTFACGYCHLPRGEGRPENSTLAGLPAAYIVQQVADIKSGARRSAAHGIPFLPIDFMREVAVNAQPADVAAAAEYFAAQTLPPRVTVLQRQRIPKLRAKAWLYISDPSGGEEALGERLLEMAPDITRHERRDPDMSYIAFVPPGSVSRGRRIAQDGKHGAAEACVSCHGKRLQGVGLAPALAGRLPTYLLRQLVAFKTGDRAGPVGTTMQAVAAHLRLADMIALAAYAASQ
jgi:cytochrome c553